MLVYAFDKEFGDCRQAEKELLDFINKYGNYVHAIKLNSVYHLLGRKKIDEIFKDYKLFLDLKLYDIPRTIIKTIKYLPLSTTYLTITYCNNIYKTRDDVLSILKLAEIFDIKLLFVSELTSVKVESEENYENMCRFVNKLNSDNVGVVLPGYYALLGKKYDLLVASPGLFIDYTELGKYDDQKMVTSVNVAKANGTNLFILGTNFPKSKDKVKDLYKIVSN